MTRRSVLRLSACGVLALAAGCSTGGTTQQADTTTPTQAPSTTTATPSATQSVPAVTTRSVHAYFLRGEDLVSVHRSVQVSSGAVASAAMTALLAGPTAAERSAGITTTVPAGTKLLGVSIAGGLGTVDLSGRYASGGGSLSMSARLAQVVFTMTQFATVQRVDFKLDGKPVTVFSGEGIVLDHPATRAQYTELLPPIFIDSPAVGETVTSPVRVQGLANVFEGQFSVDVVDGSGKVLATRPATAAMGEFRPFAVTIPYTVAQPGPGKVVGWDASPKDGSRIDEWPVPVVLR